MDEAVEQLSVEAQQLAVTSGDDGGASPARGKESHLPEQLTGSELAELYRPAGAGGVDPQPSGHHDIRLVAGVLLPEDDVASAYNDVFARIRDVGQRQRRQRAEQRRLGQEVGDVDGGDLRPPFSEPIGRDRT